MARYTDHYQIRFDADTEAAKQRIIDLQAHLSQLAQATPFSQGFGEVGISQIKDASKAAAELKAHLLGALNVKTGKLDLSKLNQSLKTSGKTLQQYQTTLTSIGPRGQAAFRELSMAIMTAEQPIIRLSNHMKNFATTLVNTAKWQLSSSMVHGLVGGVQKAYGYTQGLNRSLNNIRIVTGQTAKQMEDFAKKANVAARELSATTRDYTDAALIFYQQGLDDKAVQARTDTVIKMANVTGEAAEDVSSYMTAIWNNFDDGTKSLEYYADGITALGAATASSSEEIAGGLEKFSAIADTVGLSYEYATAALATVVSETRQGADVVGNAFKTLFARFEGLSLGETLEDGTDLNKYSQALSSVGVDIKDQVGNMRSMNDILDDLGEKWQLLSKDQQIALAQTVGGTRQYAQLVSLMDNFDTFKINVEIAEESEGTLQKQADIYAQSWEAARDRVAASAEGIYDALIDEDAFIALADFSSFFLDSLGGLIKGIDGLGGILAPIGYLLTTIFKDNLANAITSVHYSLKGLTASGREEMAQLKREAQAGYVASYRGNGGQQGQAGEMVATRLGELYQTYLDNGERLTEAERNIVASLLEENRARADAVMHQAELNDELEREQEILQGRARYDGRTAQRIADQQQYGVYEFNVASGTTNQPRAAEYVNEILNRPENQNLDIITDIPSVIAPGQIPTMSFAGDSQDMLSLRNIVMDDFIAQTDALANIRHIFNTIAESVSDINIDLSNINDDNIDQLVDTATRADAAFDEIIESMGEDEFNSGFGEASDSVRDYVKALKNTLAELKKIQKAENDLAKIRRRRQRGESGAKIDQEEQNARQESQNARQAIANGQNGSDPAMDMNSLMDSVARSEEQIEAAAQSSQEVLVQGFQESGEALRGVQENAEETAQGIMRGAQAALEFRAGVEGTEGAIGNLGNKTSQLSQQIVGFVQGVSSLAMGLNALKGIANIWTDESLSAGEKMLSTLMSMTTVLPIVTSLTKLLSVEENKNTVAKIAGIIATNKQKVAEEKNIITKGLLTLATWGLAAAQAVLNAIQNYGAVIGIAVGAAAVGAIITMAALTSSSKERAKAAQAEAEAAQAAAEATNEEAEANKGLIEAYESAKKNYEENAENKQEYIDATFALIEAYEIEGGAVLLLAGQYDTLEKAIRKARQAELDKQIKDNTYKAQLSGAGMMEGLTEGKGHSSNGKYKIEFNDGGSGGQSEEATMYNVLKSLDLKTLHFDPSSGDVQATVDLSNPEQLLQYYNELKHVTKTALEKNSKVSSSDLYQEMMEEIGELESNGIDGIVSSMETVHGAQIESVTQKTEDQIGLNTDEINSIKEYDTFVGALESNLTEHFKSLGYTGEELQAFVDQGIKNLTESSDKLNNFSVESKGFKDLNLDWKDQDPVDFYEGLSDEEKEVFWTLNLDESSSAAEVRNWLDDMQDYVAQKKFVIQLETQKTLAELIEDGITPENLDEVKKAFEKATADGITNGLSWEEFRDLPDEVRNKMVESWGEGISEDQYRNAQSILARSETDRAKLVKQVQEGEARAQEIAEQDEILSQKYTSQTGLTPEEYYTRMLKVGETIGDEVMQGAAQAVLDELKNRGSLANVDYALGKYLYDNGETLDLINQWKEDSASRLKWAQRSSRGYNEQLAIHDASVEQAQVQVNSYEQQRADKIQERLGIEDDDLINYADALKEANSELAKNSKMAENVALGNLRMNKGIANLAKNWKDYGNSIKDANSKTPEAVEGFNIIKQDIADILDLSKETISNEFIAEHYDTIAEAAQGSVEAIDELRLAMGEDILLTVGLDTSDLPEGVETIANFNAQIQDEIDDLEIGAHLKDGPMLQALQNLLASCEMTSEEMVKYLESIGVEPQIERFPLDGISDTQTTVNILGKEYTITDEARTRGYIEYIVPKGSTYRGKASSTASKTTNQSGGGGNKSKKVEDEVERYHETEQTLERLERLNKNLSDSKDQAFGQEKIDLINAERYALEQELETLEDLDDEILKYLAQDKANIAQYGATFDEYGNISNYTEMVTDMVNRYNSGKVSDDEYDHFKKTLEQYEETLDKWYENQDSKREKQREIVEKEIEAIDAKVEIKLHLSERELKLIEHQLAQLEDQAFSTAEKIDLIASKTEKAMEDSATYQQGIKDLQEQAAENLANGLYTETDGYSDKMRQDMEKYSDGLLEQSSILLESRKEVEAMFGDAIDETTIKLDEQISRFDSYGAIFDHYKNILGLSGKSIKDSALMIELGNKSVENSINKLESSRKRQEVLESALTDAQAQLEAAKARGNEKDIKYWEDTVEDITMQVEEGKTQVLATFGETLQAAADNFAAAVEQTIAVFSASMTQFKDLDIASDHYEKQKTLAEQYLDVNTQNYELSKLMRNINAEIDKTDNLAAKVKLRDVLEEINEIQANNAELSQYDLDMLNAKYQLKLAEIALEEAQNAKSQVRLTQTAGGGWGYVYTADQNAIDDAEQNYEDKLYEIQKLSQDRMDELSDNILQNYQEYRDAVGALKAEDFENKEAYMAEVDRLTEYYTERDKYLQGEFDKAVKNSGSTYKETLLGQTLDAASYQEAHERFVNETNKATDSLSTHYNTWKISVSGAYTAAGLDEEKFKNQVVNNAQTIINKSNEVKTAVTAAATESKEFLSKVATSIGTYQTTYSEEIREMVNSNTSLYEEISKMFELLSSPPDIEISITTDEDKIRDLIKQLEDIPKYIETVHATTYTSSGSGSGPNGPGEIGTAYTGTAELRNKKNQVMMSKTATSNISKADAINQAKNALINDYNAQRAFSAEHSPHYLNADPERIIEAMLSSSFIKAFDTGGYTGEWGNGGKLAMLHEKEIILNKSDTQNLLTSIEIVRSIAQQLDALSQYQRMFDISAMLHWPNGNQPIEQNVYITAEFPDATDRHELEEAFNTLMNYSSQYINRYNK